MTNAGWMCGRCNTNVAGPYAQCKGCGYKPERNHEKAVDKDSKSIIPSHESKMNFSNMTNSQLAAWQKRVQDVHKGSINKTYKISDPAGGSIDIKDSRLNDLLWLLSIESYNELCDRYPHKIDLENELKFRQ